MEYLIDTQRLVMMVNEERNFAGAFECYICHRPFNNAKVHDNDQLTGKYRCAAHERCNLMVRMCYKVPALIPNLGGYDSHLVLWGLR